MCLLPHLLLLLLRNNVSHDVSTSSSNSPLSKNAEKPREDEPPIIGDSTPYKATPTFFAMASMPALLFLN